MDYSQREEHFVVTCGAAKIPATCFIVTVVWVSLEVL